jgi:hypothetical protein
LDHIEPAFDWGVISGRVAEGCGLECRAKLSVSENDS